MVMIDPGPAPLDCRVLSLFYARDPRMQNEPVLVFHGPSTTTNSTQNTSRIQAHIFSAAGFQSFPRLTISPTSPLYTAVHQLPLEEQGDEISRGLAICLFKYFSEIPRTVKDRILELSTTNTKQSIPSLFDSHHAADLAGRMAPADNTSAVATQLLNALSAQSLSWLDVDVILPAKSTKRLDHSKPALIARETILGTGDAARNIDYGVFSDVVESFGIPSFLPSSRLRRAPSRPTAGNRSRVLSDDQKQALQREMKELFETEKSYVAKLRQLAQSAPARYSRDEIRSYPREPKAKALKQLFPSSLADIEKLNVEFLGQMEELIEEGSMSRPTERDPTGADAFAKLLLQFLPRFKDHYQSYLRASANFSTTLNDLLRDVNSSFADAVRQSGEQRLRSLLIEPVQRLPRYSLFIDNMVNQLPADHPAMSKLLRVKDTIAEICALEQDEATDNSRLISVLNNLIADWPARFAPEGRLITAVDVTELSPPFLARSSQREAQSLLLLFANYVLVVRRLASNALSARGLLAEVDRTSPDPHQMSHNSQSRLLNLTYLYELRHTNFTESKDGALVHLAHVSESLKDEVISADSDSRVSFSTDTRVFVLLGSYEGKAARWTEEVAKAKIEYRFPEHMREDEGWSLRQLGSGKDGLGLVSAVFEDDRSSSQGARRRHPGRTQVLVEQTKGAVAGVAWENKDLNADILAQVTVYGSHRYRLDFMCRGEATTIDNVEAEHFISVLTKKLTSLQRLQQQPGDQRTAQTSYSANQKIAASLRPNLQADQTHARRRFGPMSPVKALSSFLGGINRDQASFTKLPLTRSNVSTPRAVPATPIPTTPARLKAQQLSKPTASESKVSDNRIIPKIVDNAFVQLENTLSTYIVALHSRCGNIVGKVVRNRASADVLLVNELYNALLEDPNQYQATAEVPIDVLFAAFEKFLNHEWKERIGPVLPSHILNSMQRLFDSKPNSLLQDALRDLVHELNPQNQRAFSALLRLLYELLEASGNDADRGALTAAFAEVMVQEGEPHAYISLLDRLIENIDILFDDPTPLDPVSTSKNSSMQSTRAANTGSLSSTASSLKKRFGLGNLSRENSRLESESRVGQILRNLSKKSSAEPNSQPSSLSKSFLTRSRSTDNENRRPLLSRPSSKDSNIALAELSQAPSATANKPALNDVLKPTPTSGKSMAPETPRRKRRSSLSDLTNLRNSPLPDFVSPNTRKVGMPADALSPLQTARRVLRTPSPAKMQRVPGESSTKIPSPTHLKENIAPRGSSLAHGSSVKQSRDTHLGIGHSPKKRDAEAAQAPMKSRVLSPIGVGSSPHKATSPQKLKIQSPQKLRERLDREKKAIEEAGPSLQLELLRIGEEISAQRPTGATSPLSFRDARARLQLVEEKMTTLVSELSKRMASLQADIDSSLIVSEKKAKSLDELYREANAENELLYEKFNTELGKVLKSVKEGAGMKEMTAKLKEAQEEASRLRKENQRLKRENLGLRSQLKGP